MTKGKNFTYVLMAGVVAVWGLIGYRVYAGLSEEEGITPTAVAVKVPYIELLDHNTDTVELNLDYRSPFIPTAGYGQDEKPEKEAQVSTPLQHSVPVRAAVPKPQVNWSGIQYTGYIHNPGNKQRMALLGVNGNSAVLKEGQQAYGLKLLKNMGDSLKVQFQGETRFIKIK